MFDQAAQMVAMAQYLYDKYSTVNGGPDSFYPAGLPSQGPGWATYCQTQYQAPGRTSPWTYLPYCMAQEFNYSNAQPWLFMSTLNLTGGCPSTWQSNSLFTSVGSAYTANCPWIVLPAESSPTAGFPWLNGGGGGSCVVNDWNASGTWFYVTCNNYSGVPTYSTFQYSGCPQDTYGLWGGYLFCDNTGGSNTGNFQWLNNIQTKSSDSVGISVDLATPGGSRDEGVYLWSCNAGSQCGLSMGTTSSGVNGTYTNSLSLNPTGNDYNNFIALIKDTSNGGYVFNLIYNNNNTVSLVCPNSNFAGYSSVYTGPTPPTPNDLINQNYFTTPLCQVGTPPGWTLCSTNPQYKDNQGYCSAILMNNQVWYGLFQPVDLSATDYWAEFATLESLGN